MATTLQNVDVVIVGVGWCGSILAKELSQTGLKVLGLERGGYRTSEPQLPGAHDELKYRRRFELFQDLSRSTMTFRNKKSETARPVREHAAYPYGEGLGGSGVHWAGQTWRHTPADFQFRSHNSERYGRNALPADCTSQDWPVSYDELEPFYDKFEYTAGIAGKAGNIKGAIQLGGNPFEGARSREYPNPPMKKCYAGALFEKAVRGLGYHPFPMPSGNSTTSYVNPDGVRMGECVYCGFCSSYGCEMGAKASPQTTVLPAAMKTGNFELRTQAAVTKINLDSTRERAKSVTYVNSLGREMEQPASLVIVTAFPVNNVQLLLVSGIGEPYNPDTAQGTVGRNYCYHYMPGAVLFFDDKNFNRFMGAGSLGTSIADFQGDNFDHGGLGFFGGAIITASQGGGGPIASNPVPSGTPAWGSDWKKAVAKYYNNSFGFSLLNDHLSYRQNYLDLDPTYRDGFGMPLLRMTYDWGENEHRLSAFVADVQEKIIKSINPSRYFVPKLPPHFDVGAPYGVVHQVGGAIFGDDPKTSALNRYLQSWDVPNVFVIGASAFPQIHAFNPTGTVGALSFWAADAIKNKYIKNPGPLVQA
jgi:gluconate 2-dehydrogenase alpha chain